MSLPQWIYLNVTWHQLRISIAYLSLQSLPVCTGNHDWLTACEEQWRSLNKAWQSNTISGEHADGKSFTQRFQENLRLATSISLINSRKQFTQLQLVIKLVIKLPQSPPQDEITTWLKQNKLFWNIHLYDSSWKSYETVILPSNDAVLCGFGIGLCSCARTRCLWSWCRVIFWLTSWLVDPRLPRSALCSIAILRQ